MTFQWPQWDSNMLKLANSIWLNSWLFVYELSACGFESSCCNKQTFYHCILYLLFVNVDLPRTILHETLGHLLQILNWIWCLNWIKNKCDPGHKLFRLMFLTWPRLGYIKIFQRNTFPAQSVSLRDQFPSETFVIIIIIIFILIIIIITNIHLFNIGKVRYTILAYRKKYLSI